LAHMSAKSPLKRTGVNWGQCGPLWSIGVKPGRTDYRVKRGQKDQTDQTGSNQVNPVKVGHSESIRSMRVSTGQSGGKWGQTGLVKGVPEIMQLS
jgi:hypothetical protein